MRIPVIGIGVTVLALTAAVPLVVAAEQKEAENVNKTVPFPNGGTLRVKNFAGGITITGTSGHDVVVKAVRTATRDRLDHIKFAIDTSGSSVTINANDRDESWRDHNDNVVETTMEIQVPASARLDVDAFSSGLDVSGVSGVEHLKTFSGHITVRDVKSELDAESFNGSIEIDATAAGADPDLRLHTFSGRINARLSDHARGTVHFDTFSGGFDSDFPVSIHSMRKRDVTAELPGGAGHELSFHTFSGDVKIKK